MFPPMANPNLEINATEFEFLVSCSPGFMLQRSDDLVQNDRTW